MGVIIMEILVQSPFLLGKALKRFRQAKKLNQLETGKEFMLDQTTISSIENGTPGTRIETIFRLLAALDLEMVIRTKQITDGSEGW